MDKKAEKIRGGVAVLFGEAPASQPQRQEEREVETQQSETERANPADRVQRHAARRSLYRLLSTSRAHSITDNVYSYASRGEYGTCAEEAFHEMAQVLRGEKIAEPMKVTSNILLALICAMLLTYLGASAWMKQDQNRRLPPVVRNSLLGAAATIVTAHTVSRVVHNSSSSGSGGGSSGGGGGGGGGGGSHGF